MNILEQIIEADGEQWLGFIILAFISSLGILFLTSLAIEKEIDCYYTTSYIPKNSTQMLHSVVANVNWAPNRTAFETENQEEIQTYLQTVKQCASL